MATLAQLRTRLQNYVDRNDADFQDQRDFFINLAIRQLARRAGHETNRVELVHNGLSLPSGTTTLSLDDKFRVTSELQVVLIDSDGNRSILQQIPVRFLDQEFIDEKLERVVDLNDDDEQDGSPRYFALGHSSGERLLHIAPTPDENFTVDIRGVKYTTDLSADGDDNFVTKEAEDAVLYAAIAEAWAFLEDVGRWEFWNSRAQQEARIWINDRISEGFDGQGARQMGTYEV